LFFIWGVEIMRKSLLLTAVLAALASSQVVCAEEAAAPAAAAAAETPTWTFPSSISFVSDYIWRGQTQTWGNPAAQFGIEADHKSGFYAGFWGSNVSSHWLPNANLETDWSVGFRNTFLNDFKYDVGAVYVWYPDGDFSKSPAYQGIPGAVPYTKSKLNTAEIYGSLGWKWFTVKAGANPTKFYGWNTNNSGIVAAPGPYSFNGDPHAGVTGDTKWSHYFMGSVSYDLPQGFNVAGEVGRQVIENSTGLDWTWYKVGVTKNFEGTLAGWSVNAFYTGTSGSDAYKGFSSFDNAADTKDIDKKKVVIGITKAF
jgi:uncharacterized protein (TIGR02001 family)